MRITCSTYSSSPKRPADSGTSRVVPVGDVDVVVGGAQCAVSLSSVAKWPDSGATIITAGRSASGCSAVVALEVLQAAERALSTPNRTGNYRAADPATLSCRPDGQER